MQDFKGLVGLLSLKTFKNLKEEIDLFGEKFHLQPLFEEVLKQKGEIDWKQVAQNIDFYHPESIKKEGILKKVYKNNHLDLLVKLVRKEDLDENDSVDVFHVDSLKPSGQVVPDSDEKYLQGGWQNRLSLGLKSDLPNEVDWAFQKLIKLSYQHYFYIQYLPGLFDALLYHLEGFFEKMELQTLSRDFLTKVGPDLPQVDEMFFTKSDGERFERVLQSLHVLRNLSFMHENAQVFARSNALLIILAKGLALPQASYYIEIQQHCLDVFENISHLIAFRGQQDFFLACLKKMIYDCDRAKLLGALRSLIKLCSFEKNIQVIMQIEVPILQRLLQLLLVPDEEIVMNVMEFLYMYTNASADCGLRLATSVRFNILKLLFKFIHWRKLGIEVYHATTSIPKRRALPKTLKIPPPNLPPTAVPHFYAAMWLQSVCVQDPASSLSYIEFYDAYLDYSGKHDLDVISQVELLKLVVKIIGDACISSVPPLILGLRPPIEDEDVEMEEEGEEEVGLKCGISGCDGVFDTAKELENHVLEHKLKNGEGTCPWFHCGRRVKSISRHVMIHIPMITPEKVKEVEKDEVIDDELRGVQLTALLVIRNLARHSQNLELFSVYEKDLAGLLTGTRFAKTVSMVFAEIGKHKTY